MNLVVVAARARQKHDLACLCQTMSSIEPQDTYM